MNSTANEVLSGDESKESSFISLSPFLLLALLEFAAFGINLKQIGVYQDEWISFCRMHFVEPSLVALVKDYFFDPRVIVRPLEALHYPVLFFFFRESPFYYHLVTVVFEFAAAAFFYLAIKNLCASKHVGLVAAILLLLFPTHDSTHYVIVASSLAISLAFFNLSLYLYLKALDNWSKPLGGKALLAWAALSYFVSVYQYELSIPLLVAFPLVACWRYFQGDKSKTQTKLLILSQIPFVLTVISMIVYRAKILPILGMGWSYKTVFEFRHFLNVIWTGVGVSLSPQSILFCLNLAREAIQEGLSFWQYFLAVTSACAVASLVFLNTQRPIPAKTLLLLGLTGLVLVPAAYTIYGISPEHMPIIDAWLNRVNTGASVGASLVLASLVALSTNGKSTALKRSLASLSMAVITVFLLLVNWQFSKPWILSWQTQKQVQTLIKQRRSEIKSGDSIILAGVTRYVRWAPVLDGVWDLQNIIRTTLNDKSVNATVITERLRVEDDALVDSFSDIELGRFSFKNMIVYIPSNGLWQRVHSRDEFLKLCRKNGFEVGSKQPQTRR